MASKFRTLEFRHILCARNVFPEALATLSSMIKHPDVWVTKPIQIQFREEPDHCLIIKQILDIHLWYSDKKEFINIGSYPPRADAASKGFLHRMSSRFFLNGEVSYKRISDLVLLRYVDEEEAYHIMKEVHSGVCGPHMNGHLLAKKIIRTGYFWIIMDHDCVDFV